MIISWKGKIKPATTTTHVTAMWDFFPTFQQLAGRPVTRSVDGISMLPLLMNKPPMDHPYLYWEFHEQGGKQAIRCMNWKLIKLNVTTGKVVTELYDIDKDPSEKNNVAAANEAVVKKMETLMKQAHQKDNNWILLPGEK